MPTASRKFEEAKGLVSPTESYDVEEAVSLCKKAAYASFDESVDMALNLGVDPKHADQMVRGTVVLPHGTGKTLRVAVVAEGEQQEEAVAAGADEVGGSDLVEKIQGGWMEFDALVASPDMMREVGKLGRFLGPRGLMPNPKAGTVTNEIGKAVSDIKAGKVEFRVDKNGQLHVPVGRVSFEEDKLRDNVLALVREVMRLRPAASKGRYLRRVYISSTMGPSINIEPSALEKRATA